MSSFVHNTWYLAAWSSEVQERPLLRRICGEDVALFRDGDGGVHALGAACPHRGANLAEGRVVDGGLQCPFHGWRFSMDGACVRIPSQPAEQKIPRTARVPAYTLAEHQGCIWIWPGNAEPFEPAPQYDVFDPAHGAMRYGPALLDAEFLNVIENAFDESHVPFLHRKTIGNSVQIVPRQIVARDEDGRGVTCRWDPESPWGHELFERYDNPKSLFGRWMQRRVGRTLHMKRHWRFRMGGVVLFNDPMEKGTQRVLGAATPMDADRTWFATVFSHPIAKGPITRGILRRAGNALNKEDLIGTTRLLRKASALERPISVQADEGALLFRRMFQDALRAEETPSPDQLARVRESGAAS